MARLVGVVEPGSVAICGQNRLNAASGHGQRLMDPSTLLARSRSLPTRGTRSARSSGLEALVGGDCAGDSRGLVTGIGRSRGGCRGTGRAGCRPSCCPALGAVSVRAELDVQGVSMRTAPASIKALCGLPCSASTISRINARLDGMLARCAARQLDEAAPHLTLDARYDSAPRAVPPQCARRAAPPDPTTMAVRRAAALCPPRSPGGVAGPAGLAPALGAARPPALRLGRSPGRRHAHRLPAPAAAPHAPHVADPT